MYKLLFLLLLVTVPAQAKTLSWGAVTNQIRYETLLLPNPTTLYGGCKITKKWKVDLKSCGFWYKKPVKPQIQLEHVVPASTMGDYLGCGDLDRDECNKVNPKFKACNHNKNNLYPVLGRINLLRSNMPFQELSNKKTYQPFGDIIGFRKHISKRIVEPPVRAKKIVGQTYLYMEWQGCIKLNELDRMTYQIWAMSK